MSRRLHLELDFPVSYEVEQLDRIDRSGARRAYGFPDAVLLDRQQELADRPILGVTPFPLAQPQSLRRRPILPPRQPARQRTHSAAIPAQTPRRVGLVESPPNAELEAARRELQELYRQLAIPRPFSWSRMSTQRQIARLKRRIAKLESEA